ncbi:hypothetical protein [Anaerosalibacter sp. Marseille-P3206]|uniref:hypothetical protein n=1 Tax=Anaerosalibacter sp. Marseille-P3206 TaxID=1871005 RepID=UPI000985A127|nr:hypothetical protein [Anaerosalibacter sp. Marseille-P3206]
MSSIFVLEDVGRDNISVKILEMNRGTTNNVDEVLQIDTDNYKANAVRFDGSYKPDENECSKLKTLTYLMK